MDVAKALRGSDGLPPLGETLRDVPLGPGGTIKLGRMDTPYGGGGEEADATLGGAYAEDWAADIGSDPAAAEAREAAAYGELLETLKELVDHGPLPAASPASSPSRRSAGNEADEVAAGMMSGVEHADEGDLAIMASDAEAGAAPMELN